MATKRKGGTLAIPNTTSPMEAKLVEALPLEPAWQFEPKWDGFRCLAFRNGDRVELKAKSGKSLSRFFPEVVEHLLALPVQRFVIDGELLIPMGATSSFDALQMRLHPADSRIKKLSVQTPAVYVLFDCLVDRDNRNLMEEPLVQRRQALENFYLSLRTPGLLRLSPYTRERHEAEAWLKAAATGLDGVVAKRIDWPYKPGERAMLKVKHLRTADCVVGGFRYASRSKEVGSLLLGLYNDEGKLDHVGFTSSIVKTERAKLTQRLERLIQPPGFTGDAPGGPSRWTTERSTQWEPLKPIIVVEVQYDHVSGDRFRHGTKLLRFRPDKSPQQCTFEQIAAPAKPRKAIREIMRVSGASEGTFAR
jgi:ATP-dependent DNA ligase